MMNQIKFLLIILTFNSFGIMAQEYRLVSMEEMVTACKTINKDFYDPYTMDTQIKRPTVDIYYLNKNEILAHASGASKGFIFYDSNLEEIQAFFEKDEIFIPPLDTINSFLPATFEERKRFRRLNNQEELAHYWELANQELSLNHKELDLKITREYLSKAHALYKKEQLSKQGYVAIMVLLGEFVRQKVRGKWLLRKLYRYYNTYYELQVLDEKEGRVMDIQAALYTFMRLDTINLTHLENHLFNFDFPYNQLYIFSYNNIEKTLGAFVVLKD